ncbi:ChaN family lipoprotein [Roseibium sp.]|uniref:ChaN family lipoprotein n=1 Tax=Roseibium sp. TaxID=1936156 RepID=UPI003BB1EE1A
MSTEQVSQGIDVETGCQATGHWLDPETRQTLDSSETLKQAANPGVVLLGESHTSREDHLWQLQTVAGLHAYHPQMVIGFEAFPREVQPVLDEWSAGKLSRQAFLKKVRWSEVWGYDADFYMPLFEFARQNRLPMIALNVDRGLVSRVGREGWDAIPAADREGLGDPAEASADYREALARVWATKAALRHGSAAPGDDKAAPASAAPSIEDILKDPGFVRFVEAQLTWDRAMAEALADARQTDQDALVVGILGRGHVEHGYGVPHQLADLGTDPVTRFLPVRTGEDCAAVEPTLAEAVFLVDDRASDADPADRPRLGVFIETADDGGVRLLEIVDDSIAAAAELTAGDVIIEAAGVELKTSADLVEVVSRQAPGTWLPLAVLRDGDRLELVAKFTMKSDE